ncbi:MAG: Tyrosine recombinase XerC [Microgenomates bacterium OLB22]|nr:MAG: Tyrosine recombinase XerC [Microgenomates bacterium OLB22]
MELYEPRQLITKFVEYLSELKKSQHTIIAYKKDLEQFVGFLVSQDKTDIREVVKADIDGFIQKLLTDNYTKKSASRKLNSIRTFFQIPKK